MRTLRAAPGAWTARAATATLLKRQKPIARSGFGVVAGRTQQREAVVEPASQDGER